MIELLNKETKEKYNLLVQYTQLRCNSCGHSWAVYTPNGEALEARQLICRDCAIDKQLNK
jgi:hypothetical protein